MRKGTLKSSRYPSSKRKGFLSLGNGSLRWEGLIHHRVLQIREPYAYLSPMNKMRQEKVANLDS